MMGASCDTRTAAVLSVVHVGVWGFVMLGFMTRGTAEINLYYVVPAIYILHMLPFHVITKAKKEVCPDDYTEVEQSVGKILVFPELITHLSKTLDNACTFNPLSPQGMLVFGALSSAFALRSACNS